MKVSKFGEGILTSTPREILKNGGYAMQKSSKWFWHGIAGDFRHTLKNFQIRLSKQNFEKKSVFHENGVEVGGFDGNNYFLTR
jgi:hypothetical protein